MLALSSQQLTALAQRRVMRRTFIWCEARDPDTGDPAAAGFWDDVGNVELDGKLYYGSGNVISIGTLSAKGDLTIPNLTVTLSGIAPETAALIRGESVGQAPITVSIGIFDVDARALIPPLIPRFRGVVDAVEIVTPEAGGAGAIVLSCESISRALTIRGTGTRSSATQALRDPSDRFYEYTAGQREQTLYFGQPTPLAG